MNEERLLKVLVAPHISEKAAVAADKRNQFVFKVVTDATKQEVKHAVEKLFSVEVEGVQIVNVGGKVKRTSHGVGKRNDWKKAYVSVKAGQEINFVGAE